MSIATNSNGLLDKKKVSNADASDAFNVVNQNDAKYL